MVTPDVIAPALRSYLQVGSTVASGRAREQLEEDLETVAALVPRPSEGLDSAPKELNFDVHEVEGLLRLEVIRGLAGTVPAATAVHALSWWRQFENLRGPSESWLFSDLWYLTIGELGRQLQLMDAMGGWSDDDTVDMLSEIRSDPRLFLAGT